MSQPRPTYFRREALPLNDDELTEHQREALRRARAMLDGAARASFEPWPTNLHERGMRAPPAFMARIHAERPSRVLLIEGNRGSGKSSVLLTLLSDYARAFTTRGPDVVVPLRVLDMDAVPPDRNLMLEVAGSFDPLVRDLDPSGGTSPWTEDGERRNLAQAWRDFQYAATFSERGALEGRRTNLDPDAFVTEWGEAVLQRASVESSFATLVDLLFDAFFQSYRARPLFLVSLDDADLASCHVLPTLRLVRRLYHPRVFFAVAGSLPTFRMVLQNDFRGAVPKLDFENGGGHREVEGQYIKQVLSKIFPPGQRLSLPDLLLRDRFALVKASLERIPAPPGSGLANLAELFECVPQLAEMIPGNLREIVSLQRQLLEEKDWPRAMALLSLEGWGESSASVVSDRDARARILREKGLAGPYVFGARGPDVATRGLALVLRLALSPSERPALGAWSPVLPSLPFEEPKTARLLAWEECDAQPRALGGRRWPAYVSTVWSGDKAVEWPMPSWPAPSMWFRLWDKLCRVWSGLEGVSHVDAEQVLREYLSTVAEHCVRWEASQNAESGQPIHQAYGEISAEAHQWISIEHALRQVAQSSNPLLRGWATVGVGLLACPEIGLGEAVGKRLLALAFALGDKEEGFRESLERRREGLREEFGVEQPDSTHWRERVGPSPGNIKRLWEELLKDLRGFRWRSAEPHPENNSQGLLGCFTNRRFQDLQREWRVLETWLGDMKQVGRQEGDAELALLALWKAAGVGEPAPVSLQPRFVNEQLERLEADGSVWGVRPTDSWVELGDVSVARGEVGWEGNTVRSHGALLAFELAWDFAFDRADQEPELAGGPLGSAWWPLVSGKGEPRVPWPAIEWAALMDHELMVAHWNRVVARLSESVQHGAVRQPVDALAFQFVRAAFDVAESRPRLQGEAIQWTAAPEGPDWDGLFRQMRAHLDAHQSSARYGLFAKGLHRMALLAAPESGLSEPSSDAILRALVDDQNWKGLPVVDLRAERENRVKLVCSTQDAVAEAIRRWDDAASADHPWGRRFPRPA